MYPPSSATTLSDPVQVTSISNTTSLGSASLLSINLGNGLVDICALTTPIGSAVAESLVLGNRGPAGLPWAAITTFGILSVIRACVTGAIPGWLRMTLGLMSMESEQSIGLSLRLSRSSYGSVQARRNAGLPLGVACRTTGSRKVSGLPEYVPVSVLTPKQCERIHGSGSGDLRDVYALDRSTSLLLSGIPESASVEDLTVHSYSQYPFLRLHNYRAQLMALFLSLVKLTETSFLWKRDAWLLALATTAPWLFFFCSAIIVEAREIMLARKPTRDGGDLNLLAGTLPSVTKPGGSKKILVGLTNNPRTDLYWSLIWAFGGVASAGSVVITYFLLSQADKGVAVLWAAFQIMWFTIRLLVYHYLEPDNPMAHRPLVKANWSAVSKQVKTDVLSLAMAVAEYQTRIHSRGERAYMDDTLCPNRLQALISGISSWSQFPLALEARPASTVTATMHAVIGDTVLSSAAWLTTPNLLPMSLYDSCIAILSIPGPRSVSPSTIAVPAVRVLAASQTVELDEEVKDVAKQFAPKGASCLTPHASWVYWIPTNTAGTWLQVKGDEELRILGHRDAQIVSDEDITNLLASGYMNISLMHVDEVKECVEHSKKGWSSLLSLLE